MKNYSAVKETSKVEGRDVNVCREKDACDRLHVGPQTIHTSLNKVEESFLWYVS